MHSAIGEAAPLCNELCDYCKNYSHPLAKRFARHAYILKLGSPVVGVLAVGAGAFLMVIRITNAYPIGLILMTVGLIGGVVGSVAGVLLSNTARVLCAAKAKAAAAHSHK